MVKNFEESMKRIEELSNLLENEKDLDKSLTLFNEGVKLCDECKEYLEKANDNVLKVEK